jgi:hypothetical protein
MKGLNIRFADAELRFLAIQPNLPGGFISILASRKTGCLFLELWQNQLNTYL